MNVLRIAMVGMVGAALVLGVTTSEAASPADDAPLASAVEVPALTLAAGQTFATMTAVTPAEPLDAGSELIGEPVGCHPLEVIVERIAILDTATSPAVFLTTVRVPESTPASTILCGVVFRAVNETVSIAVGEQQLVVAVMTPSQLVQLAPDTESARQQAESDATSAEQQAESDAKSGKS